MSALLSEDGLVGLFVVCVGVTLVVRAFTTDRSVRTAGIIYEVERWQGTADDAGPRSASALVTVCATRGLGVLCFAEVAGQFLARRATGGHETFGGLLSEDRIIMMEWIGLIAHFAEANVTAIVEPQLLTYAYKHGATDRRLLRNAIVGASVRVVYLFCGWIYVMCTTVDMVIQIIPVVGIVGGYSVAARELSPLLIASEIYETRQRHEDPTRWDKAHLALAVASNWALVALSFVVMLVQCGDADQRRHRHKALGVALAADQPLWIILLTLYVVSQLTCVFFSRRALGTRTMRKLTRHLANVMPVARIFLLVGLVVARPSTWTLRLFGVAALVNGAIVVAANLFVCLTIATSNAQRVQVFSDSPVKNPRVLQWSHKSQSQTDDTSNADVVINYSDETSDAYDAKLASFGAAHPKAT